MHAGEGARSPSPAFSSPPMKKNLTKAIPFIFLIAVVAAFADEVFWGKLPFFRDLGPYIYPLRYSLAESFRAGHLPLWEGNIAMGIPFLDNPKTATFYPPHLLFPILPFLPAVGALLVFHYLVAAIGSFLLFRRWKYDLWLSLTGAILFTFGGILVSLVNLQDHFQTAVWLPWLLLAGDRTFKAKSPGAFIVLVFVAAIEFLAGSPEMYGMSIALLLLTACHGNNLQEKLQSIGFVAAANAVVIGLSMIQILPAIELFYNSRRPEGLFYDEAAAWSLNPWTLINLFWLDKEVDLNHFRGLNILFGRT